MASQSSDRVWRNQYSTNPFSLDNPEIKRRADVIMELAVEHYKHLLDSQNPKRDLLENRSRSIEVTRRRAVLILLLLDCVGLTQEDTADYLGISRDQVTYANINRDDWVHSQRDWGGDYNMIGDAFEDSERAYLREQVKQHVDAPEPVTAYNMTPRQKYLQIASKRREQMRNDSWTQ